MGLQFSNNAATTLSSSIASGATSLVGVDSSRFPTLASAADYFWITMVSQSNSALWEIIKVVGPFTPGVGATLSNLVRGSNSATSSSGAAQAWTAGDKIENRLNAQALAELPKLSEVNTFAAGQNIPGYATLASPTFTGTVTVPSLAGGEASTVATNKGYVDALLQGIKVKGTVRAATTANITLSGTQIVDGITLVANDIVLVKNQTAQVDNGIYTVSASAWTRAVNADTWTELTGAYVFVENNGSTQSGTQWAANLASGGTLGVTNIVWYEFGGPLSFTAGTGIGISTAGQISWTATGTGITSAIGTTAVTNANNVPAAGISGQVSIAQGGTGQSTAGAAINALLPGAANGYYLTTSGAGTYYWAAGTGGGSVGQGTSIQSLRLSTTATASQTYFVGVPQYTAGAGQTRVYINGVRQFPTDYSETVKTSSISQVARTGTTVTITTSAAHGLVTGDFVYVAAVTNTGVNMSNVVCTVTDTTHFTYTDTNTGTITLVADTGTVNSYNITLTTGATVGDVVFFEVDGYNTYTQLASATTSSATGSIVATNVQSAISELDTKKLAIAGGTMTGQLVAAAGTTTLAPLKFATGTNLTTAVAGSVEWDGTSLFVTQVTGPTRQTIAYTSSLSTYAPLASPTFTGTPTLPTGTIATTQAAANNSTAIATTAYVDAADNLKAPLSSPALTGTPTTGGVEIGYRIVPQNIQSSNYTLVLTDSGRHVYSANAGAQAITVPTNASVAFPIGTAITFVNNGTTAISFTTTSLTVYKAGTSAAWASGGTLAIRGLATLMKVATDTWFISGAGLS